jgi:hypothetical protein
MHRKQGGRIWIEKRENPKNQDWAWKNRGKKKKKARKQI